MRMLRTTLIAAMSLSMLASAAEPKLKGSKKETAPKLDLGLPTFNQIPSDQKLEAPKPKSDAQQGPSGTKVDDGYTVVRVVHGKGFMRGPDGAKPSTPFPTVTASGNPLMTEKFSSVIRVKSPAKKNTRIEVAILDFRQDTVMEASGELRFGTGDEAEWQVDWDQSGIRGPGDFSVLVRIGGNPLGTFPLKVVTQAPNAATK
jgi:hypothetical protein